MTTIYKIINNINDKVYIGKTTYTLSKRFNEHYKDSCKKYKQHRPLYKAMSIYGVQHFKIIEIEKCDDSISELREIYWINYYDSFFNGYNATLGGDGPLKYSHKIILNMLNKNPSPILIAKEIGCSTDIIYPIAKKYEVNVIHIGHPNPNKRKVSALDKDGKTLIKTFESTVKAAEWCYKNGKCKNLKDGVRSHISECARGKRKSAYGYVWKYI